LPRDPAHSAALSGPTETSPSAPDFEQALAELETLVERLERGDLPLDEALRTFERGIELTRHCQSSLKAAQQKVQILLSRSGQTQIETFEVPDDERAPELPEG
jgi:exodeoxyribonuclease VII small subunit